jgi:site-specific recombinase XerD
MKLPSIAVLLNWMNAKNKSGLYSVYIRITMGRESKYYTVPVPKKVAFNEWTGKDGAWVKNTHSFSFEINNKIKEKKEIIDSLIRRHYNLNKPLTFPILFKQLERKDDGSLFNAYFRNYINDRPEKFEDATWEKYEACLTHLNAFNPKISFAEIDEALVKSFKRHLEQKLGLEGSTIKSYFDKLKKVVKAAHKENFLDISQTQFLFDDVKIKVNKPKRIFLEPGEIKKWRSIQFKPEESALERDRDLFLFQIYTGYYYNDLEAFKKDQLIKDMEYGYFIIGERDKNGNDTIIPLFKFPNAPAIMEKYIAPDSSEYAFKRGCFIEIQAYNRNLKKVATKAGITKALSNKVARHTNAQLWVRFGAERPVLSKMMGHAKEETTKHYYDVNIPEIIEGTKKIDFDKLGI